MDGDRVDLLAHCSVLRELGWLVYLEHKRLDSVRPVGPS